MTHLFNTTISFIVGIFIALSLSATSVYAKPNIQPLAENIAEQGSQYYDFKIKEFISKDQKRIYKVWLGIPKTQLNQLQGQYSLFMLDGNSAMSYLNDEILKTLTEQHAPILVAIGYKSNLPFETASRSLDYTPADISSGKPAQDPRNPERMSGGSLDFQQIILNNITPWVEQHVKLDENHRAIWGHSYGGLFVLDSLLNMKYFSHFFAASPSLSWADQRMIKKIKIAPIKQKQQKHIWLMEGDLFATTNQQSPNFDSNGINNNREILSIFNQQGIDAKFLIYPNLKHGEVFKASLLDVLSNKFY